MHTIEPRAPSEPVEEQPPTRTGPPDWVRIALLLALTAALLGGMNWLMHSAPAPTAPVPTTTPVPTVAPAPIAQSTRLPTGVPTVRPTVAPTATVAPTVGPTAVPTLAAPLASAIDSDWWNWSSTTVDPAEEQQALSALDHRWTSITQAWWNLDWQRLNDTDTEPQLGALTAILEQRRAEGKAQKVNVERSPATVHYLNDGVAVVYETYVNHSVAVNFATSSPLEPPPSDSEAVSYLMWKVDGTYKVAEIAHHDVPQTP